MSDDPANVRFLFNQCGPNVITPNEKFSMYVSRALDCLGKSECMVNFRINVYNTEQHMINTDIESISETIYAGSKGEGLSCLFESDMDIMGVLPNVICADKTDELVNTESLTVFQTERGDTCPGYTQLRLVQTEQGWMGDFFRVASYDETRCMDNTYFTNILKPMFIAFHRQHGFQIHRHTGPSMPISKYRNAIQIDNVFSLVCVCPDILRSFLRRRRCYNWPSRGQLRKLSKMNSHVVPVGFKGSEAANKEWRICYTKAEVFLVQSLNHTQIQLYLLLKMVAKHIIKQISIDISSYMMKNIVLWMAECYPQELFTEKKLIDRLKQALFLLRHCISNNCLSSFMIPERNLLAGKLDPAQKNTLVVLLTTLLDEGGRLLLRCEKMRKVLITLYTEPTKKMELCRRRDKIEKGILLKSFITKYISYDKISAQERKFVISLVERFDKELEEYLLIVFPFIIEQLGYEFAFGSPRLEDIILIFIELTKQILS